MKTNSKKILAWCTLSLLWILALPAHAQKSLVRGTVTTMEDGTPLVGATVAEKGTNNGTTTDAEGNFQISVPPNATLVVSFIGYVFKDVPVGNRSVVDVALSTDQQQLQDLVVVGYGTQRKKDISGAITKISGEEMIQPSALSFDQMLQGKAPGVQINQTSGAPGGNVNVLIRGVSSITGGNQPLYVIDGFAISPGGGGSDMRDYGANSFSSAGMASNTSNRINPLASINPSDIESIEILKDASATAIYGSRGANGVIIITTKRGAFGKSKITVDASYGVQEVANKLEMLNTEQYAEYVATGRDNAWVFAGRNINDPNSVRSAATRVRPEFRNPESITTNTDWQDVLFRTAPVRNLQVSSTGGTEKTKYFISGGYFAQEGVIINSNYNRFNLRVNVDAQVSKRVKIGTSTFGSFGFGRFANTESHYGQGGLIHNVLSASPTIPVYDSEGNFYFNQDDVTDGLGFLANVLAVSNGTEDMRRAMDMVTNNFVEIDLTDELSFRSSIGVSYNNNNTRLWRSSAVPNFTTLNFPATAATSRVETLNWLNENTLNYKKVFNNKHFVNGLLGFTAQKNRTDLVTVGASDFPTEYVPYITAGIINAGTQTVNEWALLSAMARFNYSYDGKYMLTATIRQDGSSRFGANNKWGAFPSVSVGYNIAEEDFMKGVRFVSNLKLRASYGISGNNQIGDYTHIGLLGTTRYVSNNTLSPGLVPRTLSNDNLGWEISKQTNLGVDLGLFKDRVSITAELYRDLKTDLLLAVQLPAASGFNNSTQNIGDIENRGFELGVQTTNIQGKRFLWNTNLTFSRNRNEVLRLATEGGRITTSPFQITQVGEQISSFFLLNKLGIFMNSAELDGAALQHPRTQAGDLKFEDVNNDGVINQSDRKIVGTPWPDFTWGLDNNFTFGNLSLNVSMVGSQGAYTYIESGAAFLGGTGVQNNLGVTDRRWRSESDPGDGVYPRAIRNNYALGFGTSSHFLFDNSFIRIRNIQLSYDLGKAATKRMRLDNMTVYANVANAFTFTKYPGFDPESSTSGDNVVNAGIDYLNYPLPRTYTIGIRTSF